MSSQALGSILGSCYVRIDPAYGSRDVCSVPGREAKSLMGYPLPSFGEASIQTKTNKNLVNDPKLHVNGMSRRV